MSVVLNPKSAAPSAPQNLFRTQSLQARFAVLDQPLQLRAPGLERGALLLLGICLVGAGLLAAQPYSEKMTVQGFADHGAGHVRVRAPMNAIVERIAVKEGQQVEQGAVLLQLGSDAIAVGGRSRGAEQSRALAQETRALVERKALINDRDALRRRTLEDQRARLLNRGRVLKRTLDNAQAQLELAEDRARRFSRLAATGALAASDVRTQRQRALTAERALLDAQQMLADHELALQQVSADEQEQRQRHSEALTDWSGAAAQLQQRRATSAVASRQVLTAAVAGSVSAITTRVGARLRANQHVLSLLSGPREQAQVSLLVPSAARGAIAPGQTVRLRYAGYPHEKYGMPEGRIVRISRAPVRGDTLEQPVTASTLVYLAQVAVSAARGSETPDRTFDPLQVAPGMGLQADILVRSDPIWRRLLEPLLRLQQRA